MWVNNGEGRLLKPHVVTRSKDMTTDGDEGEDEDDEEREEGREDSRRRGGGHPTLCLSWPRIFRDVTDADAEIELL